MNYYLTNATNKSLLFTATLNEKPVGNPITLQEGEKRTLITIPDPKINVFLVREADNSSINEFYAMVYLGDDDAWYVTIFLKQDSSYYDKIFTSTNRRRGSITLAQGPPTPGKCTALIW